MERGTYVAASAGLAQMRKLEITNNNLANANTAGFKRQYLVTNTQNFNDTLASQIVRNDPFAQDDHLRTPGIINPRAVVDFSPGSIKYTGNPLDVALREAKDFFVVNTPEGLQYTRAGNFTLNGAGEIVTMDGAQVQGDGGPITVNGGTPVISPDGSVRVNGAEIGRLQVVRFTETDQLQLAGNTRFKLSGGPQPETVAPELEPGSIEMSNVSAITSMLDLITASRGFELYSKSATSIDQLNQIAINQVGRRNQ
jgi:flagellar basal-body rod protein FlgG